MFTFLNALAERRRTRSASPFASRRRAQRWLHALPRGSDYDAHHGIVEGLERFNAEPDAATPMRLDALMALEAAGLPLQARLVEQYLRSQTTFRLAQQVLWRETQQFWAHLACAYAGFFKEALMGANRAAFKGRVTAVAIRAMRYAGLAMRWEYHQGRSPAPRAWHRLHGLYRLAERKGIAFKPVAVGERTGTCAHELVRAHLVELAGARDFWPTQIEALAALFEDYADLPLPADKADGGQPTHAIDLSADRAALVLKGAWLPGGRLRYLALSPLIAYLRSLPDDAHGNVSTASGVAAMRQRLASTIERGGVRREAARSDRFGRVRGVVGIADILAALGGSSAGPGDQNAWGVSDESAEGMGLVLPAATMPAPGELLAVSWEPAEAAWQLLAVRWVRAEGEGQRVGTARLAYCPRRVRLVEEPGQPGAAPRAVDALFLPQRDAGQGLSHLLLPGACYAENKRVFLDEVEALYRLRLGPVIERHGDWVRVAMDVLARETVAA
jgi:hypothetical protein